MPQLHLYLPEDLEAEVRRRAGERGLPVSRYLAEIVRRELREGWPDDFFGAVVGGWIGDPLERPPQGDFEPRDEL